MGTFWILVSLIIFVCILLILVVMVQNPKGGGLSSTFGGGQQQIGGVKSTTDFLDKSTWVLAAIILILIEQKMNFKMNVRMHQCLKDVLNKHQGK